MTIVGPDPAAIEEHPLRVGLGEEMFGGVIDNLLPHLFGRFEHRAAADIGSAAGIGAGVKGGQVGIGRVDDDVFQRDAQRLGCDLGQDGIRTGSQIGSADGEVKAAIVV